MKTCSKCEISKSIDNFYENFKRGKKYINPMCKVCISKRNKSKSETNKKTLTTIHCKKCKKTKSIQSFSVDKYSATGFTSNCKECRNNHKNIYRQTTRGIDSRRNYNKQRYYNDTNYRLLVNVRNRINSALKSNKQLKNNTTVEILGCSISEYKLYLESLFLKGMSWDNRSEWHIDHIKPVDQFDISDKRQMLQCFNYSNTQPLWAKDNYKKSNK